MTSLKEKTMLQKKAQPNFSFQTYFSNKNCLYFYDFIKTKYF